MVHAPSHNASIRAICDKNSQLWHILRATTGISRQHGARNVPQSLTFVEPAQHACLKRPSSSDPPGMHAPAGATLKQRKGPPEGGPEAMQYGMHGNNHVTPRRTRRYPHLAIR